MRYLILGLLLAIANVSQSQIDVNWGLIARNSGSYITPDGNDIRIMGYAESISDPINIPSPVLYCEEGDSVRLMLYNLSQGAPHTIHLHGLDVNQQNDGVPSLSFEVEHQEQAYYFFKAPHPGTYIYHCHVLSSIHFQGGMYGIIVVKPRSNPNLTWENGIEYQHEHLWSFSEIDTIWHKNEFLLQDHSVNSEIKIPETYAPQYFLINGNSVASNINTSDRITGVSNEKTLLRLGNVGYNMIKITFPDELNPEIISSDGRPLPSPISSNTQWIYPGERYQVIFSPINEYQGNINVEYYDMLKGTLNHTNIVEVNINLVSVSENNITIGLYPNPTNNLINIKLSNQKLFEYSIFDVSGKELQNGFSKQAIDINTLKEGLYFISLPEYNYSNTFIKE